jgi:L,D-transpeptidase catalytic domain/Putative peptidoglycan binding domain
LNTRVANRWTPFVIGGVLLASVVGASALSSSGDTKGAPGTASLTGQVDTSIPSTDVDNGTLPDATDDPNIVPDTVPAVADVPLTRALKEGASGDDVKRLQQRLKDLHYEPGDISGKFTHLTTQAVWAFKKLEMGIPYTQVDGIVKQNTWSQMEASVTVAPRKKNATITHVEVYVELQVMVVFKNNSPVLISHVSTGTGEAWKAQITIDPGAPDNPGSTPLDEHITGVAKTPSGTYRFIWRQTDGDGWRVGKLGKMYKPTYFVGGVAVHGMTDVPSRPASHGCVRLPMGAVDGNRHPISPNNPADEFPLLVPLKSQIFLFTDYNPTASGAEGAPYDQPDPDFATTVPNTTVAPTTVAPTTVPKTTVPKTTVPATTKPPVTTTPPTTKALPATTTTTTTTATPPIT